METKECLNCAMNTQMGGTAKCSLHSKASENYERDHSHYHCWEVENSPCGIKGEHRCCLCEKPVPEIPETCPDCASEKPIPHAHSNIPPKAPTDEDWEKALFDWRKGWEEGNEAGKSEAFSLVRKIAIEMNISEPYENEDYGFNDALRIFIEKLSTLEGK